MASPGKPPGSAAQGKIFDRIKLWEDKKKPDPKPSITVQPPVSSAPTAVSNPIPTPSSSKKSSHSTSPPPSVSGGTSPASLSPSPGADRGSSSLMVGTPTGTLSATRSLSDLPLAPAPEKTGSHIKVKSSDSISVPARQQLSASSADTSSSPSTPKKNTLSVSMDDKDRSDRELKKKQEEEQRRKDKEREKKEEEDRKRREKEKEEERRREKKEEEERRKKEEEDRRREKEEEKRSQREREKKEEEERKRFQKEKEKEDEERRRLQKEKEREEEERLRKEKKERKEREKHVEKQVSKTVEFATPKVKDSKPPALNLSMGGTNAAPSSPVPSSLDALLSPRTPHSDAKAPSVSDLRAGTDKKPAPAMTQEEERVEELAKRLEQEQRVSREKEEKEEEERRKTEEVQRQEARKKELEVLEANVQKAAAEHSKRLSLRREKLTDAEKKRRMAALEEQFQRIQSKKTLAESSDKPGGGKGKNRAKTLNPAKLKQLAKAYDDRVVHSVPKPSENTLEEHFIFDSKGRPNYELMKNHFLKEGRIEHKAAKRLIEGARRCFEKEPNILELQAPCVMVGDLHGQFYDLCTMMKKAGPPTSTQYLFLGDYVDRGCFSCEVVFFLFACKIAHPTSFWMLRGNHESRTLTNHYNFKRECFTKYGRDVYNDIMHCFDRLPIAATIDGAKGRILALHGGLSPFLHDLDDIRALDRVQDVPETGSFCDLLWSDPVEEPTTPFRTDREFKRYREVTFDNNHSRGCSYVFGHQYLMEFVRDNKLLLVVRAHEVMKEGYKKHWFGKEDRVDPLIITVFSAPNYCDKYGNLGAFMRYEGPSYKFESYKHEEHPYWLPSFQNAVTYTLPYISENATKLFSHLLAVLAEDEEDDEVSQSIKKKLAYMRRASILFGEIRETKQKEIQAAPAPAAAASDSVAASDKSERRPLGHKKPHRRGKMARTTSGHF